MDLLAETVGRIRPLDQAAMRAASARLSEAWPQAEKWGVLRNLIVKYAGVKGSKHLLPPTGCTVIACADHGVARQGVSAYPPETTRQMIQNYLIHRGAVANAMSNFAGTHLYVVDMGVDADLQDLPGLIDAKIARGTGDISEGPAMTREQALRAIETGICLAERCNERTAARCLLPGEMGIGNTTSSAAMAAVLCGLTPEQAAGRGSNISDERLAHKIDILARALAVNPVDPEDPIDVLAKLGGFEFACMVGLILGGAASNMLILLDGFNSSVAALLAVMLCPAVKPYLVPSQLSGEQAHGAVLEKLGLQPLMQMDFRLGEACGSSLVFDMLVLGVTCYAVITTSQRDDEDLDATFTIEHMPAKEPKNMDRKFNRILTFIQDLDEKSMAACKAHLDELSKPVGSMGCLEQIAVELAGILGEERPETNMRPYLIVIARDPVSDAQKRFLRAYGMHRGVSITLANLRPHAAALAAFAYGLDLADDCCFDAPVCSVALARDISQELRELLLHEDGSLRYEADEFLRVLPESLQPEVSVVIGVLAMAAYSDTLVVLDDEAVEILARYTEKLIPAVRPFFLHVQPAMLQLGIHVPGGLVAMLGMRLVSASLHILNDMKSFDEVKVAKPLDRPSVLM